MLLSAKVGPRHVRMARQRPSSSPLCSGNTPAMWFSLFLLLVVAQLGTATRALSVNSPEGNFEYVGCFKDNWKHAFPEYHYLGGKNSIENCYQRCSQNGRDYFATEYYGECYCANGEDWRRYGNASNCNVPCYANNRQTCGGLLALSAYRILKQAPRPPAYSFLGCYKDDGLHVLPEYFGGLMSNDVCYTKCREAGYKYFATEAANLCFCGNGDFTRLGNATACTLTCGRNSSEICGGIYSMSVHVINHPRNDAPFKYYKGCYADQVVHDLNSTWKMLSANTAEQCRDFCSLDDNARYYGLQYGSLCYCGATVGRYGQGDQTGCNMACRGNSTKICGGVWRNSVYLLTRQSPDDQCDIPWVDHGLGRGCGCHYTTTDTNDTCALNPLFANACQTGTNTCDPTTQVCVDLTGTPGQRACACANGLDNKGECAGAPQNFETVAVGMTCSATIATFTKTTVDECRTACLGTAGCSFISYHWAGASKQTCKLHASCTQTADASSTVYRALGYCMSGQHQCSGTQLCQESPTNNYDCVNSDVPANASSKCLEPTGLVLIGHNQSCAGAPLATYNATGISECWLLCTQQAGCTHITYVMRSGNYGGCRMHSSCTPTTPVGVSSAYSVIDRCKSGTHNCTAGTECVSVLDGSTASYECRWKPYPLTTPSDCTEIAGLKVMAKDQQCTIANRLSINSPAAIPLLLAKCRRKCQTTANCRYMTYFHSGANTGYCYLHSACALEAPSIASIGAMTYEVIDYCGQGLHNCTSDQLCQTRYDGLSTYECVWGPLPQQVPSPSCHDKYGLKLLTNNGTCTANQLAAYLKIGFRECRQNCLDNANCQYMVYHYGGPTNKYGYCVIHSACTIGPSAAGIVSSVFHVYNYCRDGNHNCTANEKCVLVYDQPFAYECQWAPSIPDNYTLCEAAVGLQQVNQDYNRTISAGQLAQYSRVNITECRARCMHNFPTTATHILFYHEYLSTCACLSATYTTISMTTARFNGYGTTSFYKIVPISGQSLDSIDCPDQYKCIMLQHGEFCSAPEAGLKYISGARDTVGILCNWRNGNLVFQVLQDTMNGVNNVMACRTHCRNTPGCKFINWYFWGTFAGYCEGMYQCDELVPTAQNAENDFGSVTYEVTDMPDEIPGNCSNRQLCIEYQIQGKTCETEDSGLVSINPSATCSLGLIINSLGLGSIQDCRQLCLSYPECKYLTYYTDGGRAGNCLLSKTCDEAAPLGYSAVYTVQDTPSLRPNTCADSEKCLLFDDWDSCSEDGSGVKKMSDPGQKCATFIGTWQVAENLMACREHCLQNTQCNFVSYSHGRARCGLSSACTNTTAEAAEADSVIYTIDRLRPPYNLTCSKDDLCVEGMDPNACSVVERGLDIINPTAACSEATAGVLLGTRTGVNLMECRQFCLTTPRCRAITFFTRAPSAGTCKLFLTCTQVDAPGGPTSYKIIGNPYPVTMARQPRSPKFDAFRFHGVWARYYIGRPFANFEVPGPVDLHFDRNEPHIRKYDRQPRQGAVAGEFGFADVTVDKWTEVVFKSTYGNPVVLVGPVSGKANVEPVSAVIRNVTSTKFLVRLVQPYCAQKMDTNGYSVSWMVLEEGQHILADGRMLYVDKAPIYTAKTATYRMEIGLPAPMRNPGVIATIQDGLPDVVYEVGYVQNVTRLAVRVQRERSVRKTHMLAYVYFERTDTGNFGYNGGHGGLNTTSSTPREILFANNVVARGDFYFPFMSFELTDQKYLMKFPYVNFDYWGGAYWGGLNAFITGSPCSNENMAVGDTSISYLVLANFTDNFIRYDGFEPLADKRSFQTANGSLVEYIATLTCPCNCTVTLSLVTGGGATNVLFVDDVEVLRSSTAGTANYAFFCNVASKRLLVRHYDITGNGHVDLQWRSPAQLESRTINSHFTIPSVGPAVVLSHSNVITTGPDSQQYSYRVRLSEPPRENVTVTITNPVAPDLFGFETCRLTFTPSNWEVSQTVVSGPVRKLATRPQISGVVLAYLTTNSTQPTYNNKVTALQNWNPISINQPSATSGNRTRRQAAPICRISTCTSWGDPHIVTYDGSCYNWMSTGWQYLSRDRAGLFAVQALQRTCGPNKVACNKLMALRYKNTSIVVSTNTDWLKLPIWSPVQGRMDGWSVTTEGHELVIRMPNAVKATIHHGWWAEVILEIQLTTPASYCGCLTGMCGDKNGHDDAPFSWLQTGIRVPAPEVIVDFPNATLPAANTLLTQCPDVPPPPPKPIAGPAPRTNGPPAFPPVPVPLYEDVTLGAVPLYKDVTLRDCYLYTPPPNGTVAAANQSVVNALFPDAKISQFSQEELDLMLVDVTWDVSPDRADADLVVTVPPDTNATAFAVAPEDTSNTTLTVPVALDNGTVVDFTPEFDPNTGTYTQPAGVTPRPDFVAACTKLVNDSACPGLPSEKITSFVQACVMDSTVANRMPDAQILSGSVKATCQQQAAAALRLACDNCTALQTCSGGICVDTGCQPKGCGPAENKCINNTCVCSANYYGTFCEYQVTPDENTCQMIPNLCLNGGTCVDLPFGDYKCNCVAPFTGASCQARDECTLKIHNCAAKAVCTDTESSFTCTCNQGYAGDGTTCTAMCSLIPPVCLNGGVCAPAATDAGYTCTCPRLFSGARCETPLNPYGNIKGSMFADVNNNGIFDPDEFALVDAAVQLVSISNFTNVTVASVLTEFNGSYTFRFVKPGTYVVRLVKHSLLPPSTMRDKFNIRQSEHKVYRRQTVVGQWSGQTEQTTTVQDGVTTTVSMSMLPDFALCANGTHNCDVSATCTSNATGFTCTCNAGYVGSGTVCTPAPTTTTTTTTTTALTTASTTTTTPTTTLSSSSVQPAGGAVASPSPSAVSVDPAPAPATTTQSSTPLAVTCASGTHGCSVNATCSDTATGVTCTCNIGYAGDGTTCTPVTSSSGSWTAVSTQTTSTTTTITSDTQAVVSPTHIPPRNFSHSSGCFSSSQAFTFMLSNAGVGAVKSAEARTIFNTTDPTNGGYCLTLKSPTWGEMLYNCEFSTTPGLVGSYDPIQGLLTITGEVARCPIGIEAWDCQSYVRAMGLCKVNFQYPVSAVNGVLQADDLLNNGGGTIECLGETLTYSGKIQGHRALVLGPTAGVKGENGFGWLVFQKEMQWQGDWLFSMSC